MSKNIIYCVLGTILGFAIGFFVANSLTNPGVRVVSNAPASGGEAGPLKPEEMGGSLPPGHPEVGSETEGGGSAAATSPEAQSSMDKADRSPKDFQAQMTAARIFYNLGDYEKAALYGERALALQPKDFDALVLLGNSKYDQEEFAAAAPFYERALEIKPASPDVRTDLGNTFFRRRPADYTRAIAEYRKTLAIDPAHETTWKNLAAAALNLKDKATATEAIEKLSAINPQNPELAGLRAKIETLP
jgi:tetratricopeptide (TPR) repeat protein